jgi:signal transduction histidine kinase
LSIGDNGPGIPADQRKRVFEPFYSRRPGGKRSTGLGLSYVQRVVNEHNGRIWVAEASGQGAEFIIELPNP